LLCCSKKPLRGRQERYRALSRHLQMRARPFFMVGFWYLRDQEEEGDEDLGIQIDDEWFPVVKMDWVEGQTLREIVAKYLDRRHVFLKLCEFWEALAQGLLDAELAHLDLQHGNVLWLPGSAEGKVRPKLIDYDGMWTPDLARLPSGELGVAHYQHPERHPGRGGLPPYRPEADRFSHLVIYSALRSLAVLGPDLWHQHNNGENLLFTREDFEACRQNGDKRSPSQLLHQLWTQNHRELKWLAGRLVLAANGPLEDVPLLHQVVSGGQVQPLDDREIAQVQRILGIDTLVRVPRGTFWLSENDQNARRQVSIENEFEIGVYPVTQGQWQAVMGRNPSYFSRTGGGKDKVKDISDDDLAHFPVEQVSWEDVQEFLKKLNAWEKDSEWTYRLPTEAEWEYSCRGRGASSGTLELSKDECSFDFYFAQPTNDLSSTQANFDGNHPAGKADKGPYLERTSKVGSYPPNRLGIYDLHGNVWEWTDTAEGSGRVLRGGSWFNLGQICRAAYRYGYSPSSRYDHYGFRLARVPRRVN
jgi:formylglycine-generating enzyme required for sulfatase activity